MRALTDGVVCPVDGGALREWLDVGNLGGRFVKALAKRLREVEDEMESSEPPRRDPT